MKTVLKIGAALACITIGNLIGLELARLRVEAAAPQPTGPLAHLTQIDDREFIDLSKISYIQLPKPAGCADCETRWGAWLVVDGNTRNLSGPAEEKLRPLLGNPPIVNLQDVGGK